MTRRAFPVIVSVGLLLAAVGGFALAAQDKHTVQVPDGLAFSEFGDTKGGRSSPSVRPETCS